MAIVKMKKLRVMAMADQREALLKELLRLGCVEIDEPAARLADPDWAALLERDSSNLSQVRADLSSVNAAMDAVRKYGGVKEKSFVPRPTVSRRTFLSDETIDHAKQITDKVNERLRELSALQSEENRLLSKRAGLEPWSALDMPLELSGTTHAVFHLGVCPGTTDSGAAKASLGDLAAELMEVGSNRQQKCFLLICLREEEGAALTALRPFSFSVTTFPDCKGTAADNIAQLDAALKDCRQKQQDAEQAIASYANSWETLRLYVDRLGVEIAREENAGRFLTDSTIVFFEGWVPAEKETALTAMLDAENCAWETSEPTEEDIPNVPVKLKNNFFTRPLNMVTDMYSLPAYNGIDPNPLMAPFFVVFYGMMLADVGYGLLMVIVSIWAMKRLKPKGATMRYMTPLIGWCGASTIVWGALTGGFFGDFIPQLAMLINPNTTFTAMPALFSPLDDAVAVLIGSLILGLVQVFVGMGVSMYKQIKRGETMAALCNEGAWFLVFLLAGIAALGIISLKAALIIIVVELVITQSYGKEGIIGKIVGIGGSLYNGITGYFSDILSYSRLMALMLAGAVVAQVFNQLGAMTGNVITFVIIAIVGNALNFALNLLGCYVHDMRLQCLEFFGRFYEDGGRAFHPLDETTKYYDIVQE